MASIHKSAFETAIAIGTRSLSFYQAVTLKVKDNNTRRIFELLAEEEANHLDLFCNLYQDDDDELVKILSKSYSSIFADPHYCVMLDSVNCENTEQDALQIALKEKQACIDCYTAFVASILEPNILGLFSRILHESHKQCEIISAEYMRLMNMVDRTDRAPFGCE